MNNRNSPSYKSSGAILLIAAIFIICLDYTFSEQRNSEAPGYTPGAASLIKKNHEKSTAPETGWIATAKVVSVHDGDTVTVEVVKRYQVRLLDCWAPELKETGGIESREYLKSLVEGKTVILKVPMNEETWRSYSFGRVLGRIYLDESDISAVMVEAEHAKAKK